MAGHDVKGTPVLIEDGTDIDRSKCRRIVPMKVLVLGMCRTGTLCELPTWSPLPAVPTLLHDMTS